MMGKARTIGRYQLLQELGSGGMATVFLAEGRDAGSGGGTDEDPTVSGRPVAIKLLHSHLVTESTFFERFRREAEIGSRIRHEHIVPTLDYGIAGDTGVAESYLVMEYVEGQTLRSLLDDMGRVPEDLCRHIGRDVASALAAIHAEGIIHRDLKPENVFITTDDVVKVMDLGVAFLADQAIRLSLTGQFVGSIFYAAPEQIQGGGKDIDSRVDLYQLGLLLYELVGGLHPYKDKDLRVALRRLLTEDPRPLSEVYPPVSPFFEEVVTTLLRKRREQRFASAEEVLAVLEEGERSDWWRRRQEQIRARTRQPLRRIRIPKETALYGREEEIDLAHRLWERAVEGEGQILLIEGEGGIGKSRLLAEIESVVEGGGGEPGEGEVHVLFGTYRKGEAATAAGGFSTAYREHFGAEGIEESLRPYVRVSPSLVPAFAALLTGHSVPEGQTALNRESMNNVFVDVTANLAAERPTVLLLEDLHNAPEEGLAVFAGLSAALAGHRVLVVGTARPGLPADWKGQLERLEHFRRIRLERLDRNALRDLLVDSLGTDRLADALLPRIEEKSDGKPFYVFEILKGLREGQFIRERMDGTWVTTREIRELHVPSTVRDLVLARIHGLDEDGCRLLEVAACAGYQFDPGLIARALGMGRIPLLKKLGVLEKTKRLLRAVGRRYAFDDHQVQEAIYENLSADAKQEHHLALGEALEERAGGPEEIEDLDGATAVDLCHHFLRGGAADRAGPYLDQALDHLAAGHLNAPAVELIDLALNAERLLAGARRAEVLLRKAGHLDLLGWREEEREALEEALDAADGSGGLEARVRRRLGRHFYSISEYGKARELLTEALETARRAEDRREEAAATGDLGLVFWRLGSYPEAEEHHARALGLCRESGDRTAEGFHRGNLGLVLYALGRYDEARQHQEEYLEIARRKGDRRSEAIHRARLADIYEACGEYDRAISFHESALGIARRIGDRRLEGTSYLGLGLLHPQLGRPTPGRRLLEEARAAFQQIGYRVGEATAIHGLGVLAEEEGRPDEAEALFGESLAHRRAMGNRSGVAESLLSLGRLHGRHGRTGEATGELVEALSLGQELDWPHTVVLAACTLASLSRGDAEFAAKMLATHENRLCHRAKMEARLLLFHVTEDAGHLAVARKLLDGLLEHAPRDCRDTMREQVPLHREILAGA